MDNKHLQLNINPLVKELGKLSEDFTRNDLINTVEKHGIHTIGLRHASLDGTIKELKVPVNNFEYLERILTDGERVDGSSLFKGIVDTSDSDLYVVPEYHTVFIDPFDDNKLNVFCRYCNKYGDPAYFTPNNIALKASELLKEKTGYELRALGELEFYVTYDRKTYMYPHETQRGYHQSAPFVKCEKFVNEVFHYVSMITGCVKYCHSEVGYIPEIKSYRYEINGKAAEQYEIEFNLAPVENVGGLLTASKWITRYLGYQRGHTVTFAPKLEEGMAGNGMHVHCALYKDGKNVMRDNNGNLTKQAKQLIGGLSKYAPTLTAFGNTIASSYFRLVPNQEAPTKVCWSDSNRSTLIRVPLGWVGINNLASKVNPQQTEKLPERHERSTVELRSPDGSAHNYLLLAGITMAALDGLLDDSADKSADKLYAKGNVHKDKKLSDKFASLPASCSESADLLIKNRHLYENYDVFPPQVIDYFHMLLKNENDADMQLRWDHLSAPERLIEMRSIMHRDLHRH